MVEPRGCPCCGGKAVVVWDREPFVLCMRCGLRTAQYRNRDDAVSIWNMRVGEKEAGDGQEEAAEGV